MKVLVAVKRVVDPNVHVRVKADGGGVETEGVKMTMNPFDEIAMEAAVRLKETGCAADVLAVSCGPTQSQETLRTALAMGADRAILVRSPETLQPLGVAKLLAAVIRRENPGLVILGKQAIDDDFHQTGQMLAAMLGWAQVINASDLKVSDGQATVIREVDGGTETVVARLPAVVTVDLRLNEPRYVTLPSIVAARRKPLESLAAADLSSDIEPRLRVVEVREPIARKKGRMVNDVQTLYSQLKNEAKVI
ncbi:hypothetical protein BOSP111201_20315 [Bordetella sputigena]|uniref:electron transfer flavoprotein subunit beta/FixA family protein n=1 Tax=Bordetella sputigena TaxID=1416810 RepID=UPI0039EF054E